MVNLNKRILLWLRLFLVVVGIFPLFSIYTTKSPLCHSPLQNPPFRLSSNIFRSRRLIYLPKTSFSMRCERTHPSFISKRVMCYVGWVNAQVTSGGFYKGRLRPRFRMMKDIQLRWVVLHQAIYSENLLCSEVKRLFVTLR